MDIYTWINNIMLELGKRPRKSRRNVPTTYEPVVTILVAPPISHPHLAIPQNVIAWKQNDEINNPLMNNPPNPVGVLFASVGINYIGMSVSGDTVKHGLFHGVVEKDFLKKIMYSQCQHYKRRGYLVIANKVLHEVQTENYVNSETRNSYGNSRVGTREYFDMMQHVLGVNSQPANE